MASVFITGSADGLGRLAAQRLVTLGHDVVLHGRDRQRAQDAMRAVPGARTALVGDLASIEETRALAEQANAAGLFQAVIHNAGVQSIHNAGVYRPNAPRLETVDGLENTFAVNALAPYLLTALIASPQRLVFLTSELHEVVNRTSATCSGVTGAGADLRRTQTRNCLSLRSHSVSHGVGLTSYRTPSIPGGFPPGWAAPKPRTTLNRA